ncbi:MAG: cupredoxin domain-containing protein [Nitrospirota bacterium]|jgi:plastocyanin
MVRRVIGSALVILLALARATGAEGVQQRTVHLGDYAFHPAIIEVVVGEPVELTLINDDRLTPHNLTLDAAESGLHVDVDVGGHKEKVVRFTPSATGRFPFVCNKKLLFFKSHRDHGMVGELVVRTAP